MPRIFVAADRLGAAQVTLAKDAHHYLTQVLRLRAGDPVTVFDGLGTEVAAQVDGQDAHTTTLSLGSRTAVISRGARITLLQAIPKGERMDWLTEKATELGVCTIVPMITMRSVVKPAAAATKLRRWRTLASEAARQCGRADVPIIEDPVTFDKAIAAAATIARKALLWESAPGPALRSLFPPEQNLSGVPVALVIGPEGGFAAEEVAAAEAQGFIAARLGDRILRVDTAAITALAIVQSAAGALD